MSTNQLPEGASSGRDTTRSAELNETAYQPLTKENLEAVYELLKRNEPFYHSISLEFFRRGILRDEAYDPDLTIVLADPKTSKPIATFIAVVKKGWVRKNCYLKVCIVDKQYQRQGIGSRMLQEIMHRARRKLHWYDDIRYGDSAPRYWQPGVDLRHTSLIFFLKKHGFEARGMRYNLTCSLGAITKKPESEKNGFRFERVKPKDFEATVQFVKKNFRFGFWSREVPLSYENDPPTTFIAKDRSGTIIGFASHGTFFPGCFGPTGVQKSLRGKGIGSELLRWCLWDMKQAGIDTCTIMWVTGDTIKFYSKILGAYIHPVFHTMSRRI
nr:GNAT family N-acetyltransferase [Candidatus Njordarchaeota archaeon]